MKPIKINNLEDLALAIKLSNAQAVRERNNEPPEYRHFTNAEGDIISKMPEDQQAELKRLKTLPNRKGYIAEDRRPIMSASSNNGKNWVENFISQSYSADEMAAAGFGIDFGNMEDPRAFVKVQDGIVEVIPEAQRPYKHEATFTVESTDGDGLTLIRPFPNAKAKR